MQIFRSLQELDPFGPRSIVTVGNFDGVHLGHRMVLRNVLRRAGELWARSVAVTFDPHPAFVLNPARPLRQITPLAEKLRLLAATGLDAVLVLPFTEELRSWTARHFAETILRDALTAVEVHEGETFRFGYGAEAGVDGLVELGHHCSFSVRTYDPLVLRGAAVSSSRIRALVAAGSLHEARALLGRPFAVLSHPASGRGYGTRYAVPTINLAPYTDLLPANGVYVTTLQVGGDRIFRGVTNAGNRPTFGADSFAVETHLLDFEPIDLEEGTPLELTFLARLRAEQHFPSPDLLREQIGRDVQRATRYFELCKLLGTTAT
jgi:riboflavin kinase/FMN adenylyltransferase